ncbi:Uncharacterised protein [Bordetella pertussis]|nr:Uncharacterised protein [Bordetella pertussis]
MTVCNACSMDSEATIWAFDRGSTKGGTPRWRP